MNKLLFVIDDVSDLTVDLTLFLEAPFIDEISLVHEQLNVDSERIFKNYPRNML